MPIRLNIPNAGILNQYISVALGTVVTTSQFNWVCTYDDSTLGGGTNSGQTTDTAPVTLISFPLTSSGMPANGIARKVTFMSVNNADTVANVLTIYINTITGPQSNPQTVVAIPIFTVNLMPGFTLIYDEDGFQIIDANGVYQSGNDTKMFYTQVDNNWIPLPQRNILNANSGLMAVDVPSQNATNISMVPTGVVPGTYGSSFSPVIITLNQYGQVTFVDVGNNNQQGITTLGFAETSNNPIYNTTGVPVTTPGGTIDITLKNQVANNVFAGPTSGSPAQPSFRLLTSSDLPAGTGTVTSVGLADTSTNPIYTVSNSPVTASGTINIALNSQNSGTLLAGPVSGTAIPPSFRKLVTGDLPITAPASFAILTTTSPGGNLQTIPSGNSGQLLFSQGAGVPPRFAGLTITNGTVTSVGLQDNSTNPIYAISNSPITSSGNLGIILNTQNSHTLLMGPTTDPPQQPSFRLMQLGDLPQIPASSILANNFNYQSTPQAITTLPNGIKAVTQVSTDSSTLIATDSFVQTVVNNAIAGVNPAVAVKAATTAASDTSSYTYNNGVAGIGATLTGTANVAFTCDGVTFTALNQRVLIKNDTQSPSGAFNGVYYVTQIQTALLPPILTRALDYDQPSDINNTGAIPVVSGTVNGSTTWVLTSAVTTVGTDALTYTQFSLNPTTVFNTAGTGLTGSGNTVSLSTPVSLANGGTNNGLTANNGGVVWSDASKLNILAGTATANKALLSGSTATPAWSTATFPTDAAKNDLLYASANSAWARLATANSSILITDGSGNVSWGTTTPTNIVLGSGTTAITQANLDNSTKVATTAYIDGQMNLGASVDFSGTAALQGASSITYNTARYVKFGKMYYVLFDATFTNAATTKSITLPFTVKNSSTHNQIFSYNYNGSGAVTISQTTVSAGSTTMTIYYGFSGGSWGAGTNTGCIIAFSGWIEGQ